mgnify:CR=1 FL=1
MKRAVLVLLLAVCMLSGNALADQIDVSQPTALTDNSGYDRNPSVFNDGTDYWLFYTKGDNGGIRGDAGYDPDADSYVVYYKKASTIDGLASAGETKLVLSESARPANFSQRVVSATEFDGDVYAFVSSGQDGTNRGMYYYRFDGSNWSGPVELIADATARGGHVNVTADDNRVYIVWESSDGSSDCYTWDGTSLSNKVDISGGKLPKITLFTGNRLGVLYVVNVNSASGDIEVFQAATDTLPGFGPHSVAIPGGGLYDPCIFNDGSNLYVISAPYVSGDDRQYLVQTKSVGTSTNWSDPKTICYGGHSGTSWWDYWPVGYHDGSDAYVFFTTETDDGPFYSDAEIGYTKLHWDLTHDHYFYIKNAAAQSSAGDFVYVYDGLYLESAITVPNGITIEGENRTGVVIAPQSGSDNGFIYTSSNTTFRNLTIDGDANPILGAGNYFTAGITVASGTMADNITVQDVTIKNTSNYGIKFQNDATPNGLNYLVDNCTIENVQEYYAIRAQYVELTVANCDIQAAPFAGIANVYGNMTISNNNIDASLCHGHPSYGGGYTVVTYSNPSVPAERGYTAATGNTITDANVGIVTQGDGTMHNNDITITVADGGGALFSAGDLYPTPNDINMTGNTVTLDAVGALGFNLVNLLDGSKVGGPSLADRNSVSFTANARASSDQSFELNYNLGGPLVVNEQTGQAKLAYEPDNNTSARYANTVGMIVWWCPDSNRLTIENNLIECGGNGSGIWLYHNQESSAPIILGNEITSSASTSADPSEGAGIFVFDEPSYVGESGGGDSYAEIRENFISGFVNGVYFYENAGYNVSGTVFENDLSGNTGLAINNPTGVLIDGHGNWFGDSDPAFVAGLVSANVDFSPWLAVGTDTSTDPGFQGDFATLWVDDDSPVSGALLHIAEGIDLVNGSTVYVAPGTYYEEDVTLDKSLDLVGLPSVDCTGPDPNAPILDGQGADAQGFIIAAGVDDVLIDGFFVRNFGLSPASGGQGCGIWAYGNDSDPTTNITVQNCQFDDIRWASIFFFNDGQSAFDNINVNCNIVNTGTWSSNTNVYGIEFTNCQNSTISNNQVSGGFTGILITAQGRTNSATVDNITVDGNTVTGSVGWTGNIGLNAWDDGYSATVQNITITDNVIADAVDGGWGGYGIRAYATGGSFAGSFQVNNNEIKNNADYGIDNGTGVVWDATCNWWGDITGPYNDPDNLYGQGNEVSGDVDFSPWSNDDFSLCTFTPAPETVYVDDDYTSGGANDGHFWGYDAFAVIQDGVDHVAENGTVIVYDGTYTEQVEISKSLVLEGSGVPSIEPPTGGLTGYTIEESSHTYYPLLLAYGGSKDSTNYIFGRATIEVTISGMTVDGNNSGSLTRFPGMLIRNCVNSTVTGNEIKEMLYASGNPETFGMLVFGASDITISDNTVNQWTRGGIGISGDAGALTDPVATVFGNTVIGRGPVPQGEWAQNGIQVSYGAQAVIDSNEVYDIDYIPDSWAASAINIYQAAPGTSLSGNNVHDSEAGLYLTYCDSITVDGGNIFDQNEFIFIYGGDGNVFDQNTVTNSESGLYIADATNVTVTNNTMTANDYAFIADGLTANATFTGNTVTASTSTAFYLSEYNGDEPTGIVIFDNSFSGNAYGIENTTTVVADASANWWGDASGPNVGVKAGFGLSGRPGSVNFDGQALERAGNGLKISQAESSERGSGDAVSANVDFSPWLAVGTDTSTDPGFQGDFATLWVDDDSPVSGALLHIAEGIDLVNGSTVYVAPGTYYEEDVTLDKSLDLVGLPSVDCTGPDPNAPILDGQGADAQGFIIAAGVDDVLIDGFFVRNFGLSPASGGQGCGIWAYGNDSDPTTNITVQNCQFDDIRWASIFFFNDGQSAFDNINVNCNIVNTGTWSSNTNVYGIEFTNCQNSTISNNQVSGGFTGILITAQGRTNSATVDNITVDGNTVTGSVGWTGNIGLNAWDDGYSATVQNITITDNVIADAVDGGWGGYGIRAYATGGSFAGSFQVNNNEIKNNADYGIDNGTGVVWDATCNWWGDITGPYNATSNPLGQGNEITDNATFQPWSNEDLSSCSFGVERDTVWVDDDYTPTGTNDGHVWGYDAFDNLPDGVSAVRADGYIYLLEGTYEQQVEVAKNVIIDGAGSTLVTIQSPTSLTTSFTYGSNEYYPVVCIHDATVELEGVTVDGLGRGNGNYRFTGIGCYNAEVELTDCDVVNIQDTPFSGSQHGLAILVYNDTDPVKTAVLTDCDVSDFQKNGITVLGEYSETVITNCTATGKGLTDVTAQNGIEIASSASGTVDNCDISLIAYDGTDWTATGFLVSTSGTVNATAVNIDQCQTGVYWINGSGSFDGGTITNPIGDGFYAYNGSTVKSTRPKHLPDGIAGIQANPDKATMQVSLTNSIITGNSATDSWGVGAFSTSADPVELEISYCAISDWDYGIYVYDYGGPADVTMHYNRLATNNYAITSTVANLQDGSTNSYGVNGASAVAALIDGNIDYTPWIGSSTDTDPGTTGFQPSLAVLYVDDDSPQFGSVMRIQEALGLVDDAKGGSIYAVDGTYYESVNFDGRGCLLASLYELDSVDDHIVNTIIDANSDSLGAVDTASAVYFVNGEGAASTLKGFTLVNGFGTINPDDLDRRTGGAILCDGSSPTIERCVIAGNNAVRGGGIGLIDASPTINNCTIVGNDAPTGGGISMDDASKPEINRTIVAFSTEGAAVECVDGASQPDISCTDIYGNNLGNWVDCIAGLDTLNNNLTENPLFCDKDNGDYYIDQVSYCAADNSPCFELIGALGVGCSGNYICGDANSDGVVDVSDAVYIINYAFAGGPAPDPIASADANCDSVIDVSDAVYIINYAFSGGNPPCDTDGNGIPDC